MSIRCSKLAQTKKQFNENSPLNKKIDSAESKTTNNNEEKQEDNTPQIKVDYKSSNYFYNDEDYFKGYPYKRLDYYNTNDNKRKYNIDSNSSHITVENEDGIIKYIPNNKINYNYNYQYNNYNDISPKKNNNYIEISSHKNLDYYDDNENSEYSENNDNENIYYDNENEEYENRMMSNEPKMRYNQYQENINFYLAPNTKQIKKKQIKNQNIISKAITHEINYSSDKNLKIRPNKKKLHNCGNNTTTTNNTYNNNIYYINPINVKNKNKTKDKNNAINNNKGKKSFIANRKNFIYKSVDITLQKRRNNKEKDYFKINNIDKSKKDIYIKAAILIQSALRGYLVKIKLYNNVNLYVCCKRAIDILQELILNYKNDNWKAFKKNINRSLMKTPSYSIRAKYKLKNSKIKDSLINVFHKEAGDSFNIINKNIKKDNKEKKLKSKLNDIMRENNELRNQLFDNRNIEIKLKSLINENKKNQNINAIIMKDNMQLAKKLKDIQDYRNHRLFIENQYSIDLNQIEKLQMNELNRNNEIFISKLKNVLLRAIISKKISNDINMMKAAMNIYRNIAQKMKNKDKEDKLKKEMHFKNIINIINKNIKLLLDKNFWKLYYYGLALEKEEEVRENNLKEKLKKLVENKDKKNKKFLNKVFFKFVLNNVKFDNEEIKNRIEKEKEEEKENLKLELMRKLIIKYEKNVRLIYKIILEKWNLKAKIIGMRTAARDKKKKRKQKKKNLRLLYNNKYAMGENNIKTNYGPKFCKSIHEFSYIVSNGNVIKESNSNQVLLPNKSTTNMTINNKIRDLKNTIDEKEIKKKKTKSVTKRSIFNDKKESQNENKDNINNNEESDEDSGDSFGLENNSDC